MQNLNSILDSIADAEGGYWGDDPYGGETNHGITNSTLQKLRIKSPMLPKSVKDLDKPTARLIIEREYIVKRRIHELPLRTALVQGHLSVMAWDDGIKIMQRRLNLDVDGIIGDLTIKAVNSQSKIEELIGAIDDVQTFLAESNNKFVSSYEKRLSSLFT